MRGRERKREEEIGRNRTKYEERGRERGRERGKERGSELNYV